MRFLLIKNKFLIYISLFDWNNVKDFDIVKNSKIDQNIKNYELYKNKDI